jgi:hypothetical protein
MTIQITGLVSGQTRAVGLLAMPEIDNHYADRAVFTDAAMGNQSQVCEGASDGNFGVCQVAPVGTSIWVVVKNLQSIDDADSFLLSID